MKLGDSYKKPCPKLKILALHGYRQNADSFRAKTGSFRKMFSNFAELTFVNAPHKLIDMKEETKTIIDQTKDGDQYGWFFNRDDKTFKGTAKGGPAVGFIESIEFLEEIFRKKGPFDGILGFSQGACLLGLLCHLQQRGLLKFTYHFAILVSGFKSGSLPHLKYYTDMIQLPTMHIFGKSDQIIPTEMSEALSNLFEVPIILKHDGGHYLPASALQKSEYKKFAETQLLLKYERETKCKN